MNILCLTLTQECSGTEDGEDPVRIGEQTDGKEATGIPIISEQRKGRKRVGDIFREFERNKLNWVKNYFIY